ncbi:MAG TPA: hypothetical protein VKV80_16550 [Streptosporangiaceae bacterium]|jgi:hypothetical protein|nr:hypothetical protein [Streptosporangiaceae bacterium]
MTSDQPMRERTGPAGAWEGTGEEQAGGDPACWACLVCEECGAVISEGHLGSCSRSGRPPAPAAGPGR